MSQHEGLNFPLPLEAVILGLEGSLLYTEMTHFGKWWKFLVRYAIQSNTDASKINGLINSLDGFKETWKKNFAGMGDRRIYEYLKEKIGRDFPSWEICAESIDEHYQEDFLNGNIRIPEGAAQGLMAARRQGIAIVIVSELSPEKIKTQLAYLDRKGVFHGYDKIWANRNKKWDGLLLLHGDKEGDAYKQALELAGVRAENALAVDTSQACRRKAAGFGIVSATMYEPALDEYYEESASGRIFSWDKFLRSLPVSRRKRPSIGSVLSLREATHYKKSKFSVCVYPGYSL